MVLKVITLSYTLIPSHLALLNRVTRSVEDAESEVEDLEDDQDLAFEARDTRGHTCVTFQKK